MKIENRNGIIRGYADLGDEIERHVITLYCSEGVVTVVDSVLLPTNSKYAKNVISCYKVAFDIAEIEIMNQSKTQDYETTVDELKRLTQ